MAKGNLFLGYARGKVGDVVFSRTNGEQVSRARNRHPNNPRTNAQLAQRAVMSTIAKAYAAGMQIFDHSFEGLKVGSGCQQRFAKVNVERYRSLLALELATPPVNQNGVVIVKPGAVAPVGGVYIVSEGSLPSNFFTFSMPEPGASGNATLNVQMPGYQANEKLSAYCSRCGLVADDIYTFVFFADPAVDEIPPENHRFGFVRLRVNAAATTSQDAASGTSLSTLFDVMSSDFVSSSSGIFRDGIPAEGSSDPYPITSFIAVANNDYELLTVAVIRSRESSGLRSSAEMQWCRILNHGELTSVDYINAWRAATERITEPELILEGGE